MDEEKLKERLLELYNYHLERARKEESVANVEYNRGKYQVCATLLEEFFPNVRYWQVEK